MDTSTLLDSQGLRAEGRTPTQLRPISCGRSTLSRSDGSATWTVGGTTVVASVYGPRTASSRSATGAFGSNTNTDDAVVSVDWRWPGGVGGGGGAVAAATSAASPPSPSAACSISLPDTAAASEFVRSCVRGALERRELPPRSAVGVTVHVISGDGSELSAAANAVAAALADAAMPLRFSFAAATVAVVVEQRRGGGGGTAAATDSSSSSSSPPPLLLLLDPTSAEEASSTATATVAFPCASRKPGAPPTVDSGKILALRCCSSSSFSAAVSSSGKGGKASTKTTEANGFGTDAECLILASATEAAAKGAQRVAEFARASLEASYVGGGGGGL